MVRLRIVPYVSSEPKRIDNSQPRHPFAGWYQYLDIANTNWIYVYKYILYIYVELCKSWFCQPAFGFSLNPADMQSMWFVPFYPPIISNHAQNGLLRVNGGCNRPKDFSCFSSELLGMSVNLPGINTLFFYFCFCCYRIQIIMIYHDVWWFVIQ